MAGGAGNRRKYDEGFPAKVAAALDGDGRPEIQVVDLRAQGPATNSDPGAP